MTSIFGGEPPQLIYAFCADPKVLPRGERFHFSPWRPHVVFIERPIFEDLRDRRACTESAKKIV